MKILFIFLILFSLSLFAQNLKKITLQLNWLNQFQFAGYYIAKEKGFYKKLGLDVEIKELNQTTDFSNSNFDFAVGRSSLIIDKINGKDVVALASIFQTSPLILLTRKDTNINSVDDLKNKRIMITSDANNTASILAMLYSRKIYMKDFIRQEHTFNLEDLITKKTDAMASYISNEPIILKEKSIEYNILDPKEYGFDFYSDILYTSSKYIKSNPTITRKFLEASLKGWYYAFENITETAEIIHNKYNSQNKTLVHLIKEGDVLKKLAFDKSDRLIGCIEKNRLLEIVNVFKVLGVVKNDMDIDSFIYEFNPHSNIVVKLTSEQKDILILIGVFSILIFIIITILLRKNQKSKDLLNTVINSTTDLIFYKDSQFNYIGCNDAFSEFVGKSKKQIIGSCDYDLFEDADAQLFRNNDIKALEDNSINIY